ncbi:hypothetical protein D9M71_761730 [compost metagenome]
MHIGIHRAELAEVVGRIRKHACLHCECGGLGLLFGIGRFAGPGLGRGADEAGKVVEVQALGNKLGLEEGAVATDVDLRGTAQVAVAGDTGEVLVAPDIVVALEAAFQAIRRGGGDGQADQWIQVFHVLAAQREI